MASACGFRGSYSCGAAGEFDPFPFIRLQPIIDLFYLSTPSMAPSKKGNCALRWLTWLLRQQKTSHDSSQRAVASSVYWGKIERPFSLFRRGRLKMLWAGFLAKALTYSPRLPISLRLTVTCVAAFVAITVAGPRRIFTGLP